TENGRKRLMDGTRELVPTIRTVDTGSRTKFSINGCHGRDQNRVQIAAAARPRNRTQDGTTALRDRASLDPRTPRQPDPGVSPPARIRRFQKDGEKEKLVHRFI